VRPIKRFEPGPGRVLTAHRLNELVDALNQLSIRGSEFISVNQGPDLSHVVGLNLDMLLRRIPHAVPWNLSWGKAVADWSAGNEITLDPCNAAGVDNGLANVTAYIDTDVDKTSTGCEPNIETGDVLAYLPYGQNQGILVNATRKGGTAVDPYLLLPNPADWETETAQADTWDRAAPPANKDGVSIQVCMTRVAYNDAGDKTLYSFERTLVFDSHGCLLTISAETRRTIDSPVECPP
jgi:hypothetical protein